MSTLLSLKWNHHHSTFVSVFAALKRQDLFSDVSIICGARIFPAHKIVLAASSPFFQQMLAKQPLCTQHHALVIVLQDVDCGDFEILLDYMYKGEAAVQQMALSRLIKTAEKLKIRGLAGCDSSPQLDRDNEAMLAAAACDKVADRLYIADGEHQRSSGINTSQQTKNERLLRRLSEFSEAFSDASCEANDAQDKQTESQIESIDNNRLLQSIVNNIDIVKIGSEVTANSSWNKSLDSDEIVTEDNINEDDSASNDRVYMQITEEEPETDKASTAKRKTKDQVFSDKDDDSLSKRPKIEDENVSKTHHNLSTVSACNDASDADSEDPSQEQLLDAKAKTSLDSHNCSKISSSRTVIKLEQTSSTSDPFSNIVLPPSTSSEVATIQSDGLVDLLKMAVHEEGCSLHRSRHNTIPQLTTMRENHETQKIIANDQRELNTNPYFLNVYQSKPSLDLTSSSNELSPSVNNESSNSQFELGVFSHCDYTDHLCHQDVSSDPGFCTDSRPLFLDAASEAQMYGSSQESQERVYVCPSCPYRSYKRWDFVNHVRIHTGEKPFNCPYCPHRSALKNNLRRHIMLKHTDK